MNVLLKKVWAGLLICATLLFMGSIACEGMLDSKYLRSQREINEQSQKTEKYEVKGVFVFLARDEVNFMNLLQFIEVACGGFVVISIITDKFLSK